MVGYSLLYMCDVHSVMFSAQLLQSLNFPDLEMESSNLHTVTVPVIDHFKSVFPAIQIYLQWRGPVDIEMC